MILNAYRNIFDIYSASESIHYLMNIAWKKVKGCCENIRDAKSYLKLFDPHLQPIEYKKSRELWSKIKDLERHLLERMSRYEGDGEKMSRKFHYKVFSDLNPTTKSYMGKFRQSIQGIINLVSRINRGLALLVWYFDPELEISFGVHGLYKYKNVAKLVQNGKWF